MGQPDRRSRDKTVNIRKLALDFDFASENIDSSIISVSRSQKETYFSICVAENGARAANSAATTVDGTAIAQRTRAVARSRRVVRIARGTRPMGANVARGPTRKTRSAKAATTAEVITLAMTAIRGGPTRRRTEAGTATLSEVEEMIAAADHR